MSTLKLIATRNFIALNKDIARAVGLNEAIVLGALCSESVYCESRGITVGGGFFPFSVNALQEETTLGEKPQKTALRHLIECGLVEQKNLGLPQTRHFRVIEENVIRVLNGETITAQTQCQEPPFGSEYNSNNTMLDISSNKVDEEIEPFSQSEDIPQVTESNQPSQDEMIHNIIKSWNAQKLIRTPIDRIVPMSKRYNDTFLCISQFGYDAFIYQILSLDQNGFFEQWQPFYDWFCDPNNFIKVYEGNYRNSKTKEDEVDKEWIARWLNDEE